MKRSIACLMLLTAISSGSASGASPAAAELSLDRNAVAELVMRSLPEPVELEFGGRVATVRIEGPTGLQLIDGGVEADFRLRVDELELGIPLSLRYVPEVDRLHGTVSLVPESVRPDRSLPFRFDLSSWFGDVELPRRFDWEMKLDHGAALEVIGFVHGVEITENRLRITMGLNF